MRDDPDEGSLVEEMLSMAKEPDAFSKSDLGVMLLVAATEIMKLRAVGTPSEIERGPGRIR